MRANEAARLELALDGAVRSHVVRMTGGDGMVLVPARADVVFGLAALARLR
jgi:hypothetical protein